MRKEKRTHAHIQAHAEGEGNIMNLKYKFFGEGSYKLDGSLSHPQLFPPAHLLQEMTEQINFPLSGQRSFYSK